jgi:hypothetical protein
MTLPSDEGGATTAQVGYFEVGAAALADWLVTGFDEAWTTRAAPVTSVEDAVALLAPHVEITRYLCAPVGHWTALLNNTPLGTDVGVLPSYAARELHRRAMRVTNVDDTATYPARILEVYGPNGAPPLAIERSITAANDGGRWIFETFGPAYPFEDLAAYTRRVKATRFTTDMVYDYLRALGVPVDEGADWPKAILVERAT